MRQIKIMLVAALALSLIAMAAGCRKKSKQQDAFIEKWRVMAAKSDGHTPTHKPNPLVLEQTSVDEPSLLETLAVSDKPLPSQLITLRMHKANLAAVIQALSRAASQSVMLSPGVGGEVTVNIVKKPWDQVFKGIIRTNGLTYAWEGDIIRVMTLSDMQADLAMDEVRNQQLTQRQEANQKQPLFTSVFNIKYADATDLKTIFEKFLTKGDENARNTIEVDVKSNSIVVQARREDIERIFRLVDKLDRPRTQVKLKAHIVEMSTNIARELGTRWGGYLRETPSSWDGKSVHFFPGGIQGAYDSTNRVYVPAQPTSTTVGYTVGQGMSGHGFGLNFVDAVASGLTPMFGGGLIFDFLDGQLLELQINALASDNKVKILSNPTITTMDNETAFCENGRRVPYVTTNDNTQTVQFEDVTLRLEMTPHVIDEEYLRLKIMVKNDAIDNTVPGVQGNPVFTKRETQTTLIVRNKETVVISGLTTENIQENETGLPFIKDIPLVGWLFKDEVKQKAGNEILIFITPTILPQWRPGEIQETMKDIEEGLKADQADKK